MALDADEREALLERVRTYERAVAEQVEKRVSSWPVQRTSPQPWAPAWSRTLRPPTPEALSDRSRLSSVEP
ncbi:hypothetical protein GCM10010236_75370 [Streptomyces eurythermus]|nr:hypothetical protein GCM10010236_75370 [Streptomyces eurythermus]